MPAQRENALELLFLALGPYDSYPFPGELWQDVIPGASERYQAGILRMIHNNELGKACICLGGGNVDDSSAAGQVLLHAVRTKLLEPTRLLLSQHADVNAADAKGISTLCMAVVNGDEELTHTLLEAGANTALRDRNGHTALHHLEADSAEIAKDLLAHSADRQACCAADNCGNTPLLYAAFRGNAAVLKVLLEAGADPHAANELGFTPLHYAAHLGQGAAVKVLLAAGADPHAAGRIGITPLHADREYRDIHEMLWNASGRRFTRARRWLHNAKFHLHIGRNNISQRASKLSTPQLHQHQSKTFVFYPSMASATQLSMDQQQHQ